MANKTETSSKNIKPRTNLNHNIYIIKDLKILILTELVDKTIKDRKEENKG